MFKQFTKYISMVFLILLAAAGLVMIFQSPYDKAENVSVSELVTKINAGQVKEITVKGDNLDIVLKDGDKKLVSQKETGVSTFETLLNLGTDKEKLSAFNIQVKDETGTIGMVLSSIIPIVLPFLLIILIFWFMFNKAQKGSTQAFSFGKSKARLANQKNGKKRVTFGDVAGLIEAKEEISEIVEFLKDPKKFHKLGARIPRGILLVGSPGTGKTLLAKAVASEANVPFYFVSGSEFVEMFVGVGANRVRDMFDLAKKTAPAIVFVDEIDAVGRHRGAGLGGGHDEREQTLNQILVEMDGFDTDAAVIVMAATNRPDILDPALLRPGRFDRRIILDEPSMKDREEILKIHALDKPLSKTVNLKLVAERTPGLSGADLANLINEAAILAARSNQKEITQDNLFEAIEKVILGPERRSHIFSKKEKEITAYHEAGHALVACSLPFTDPVHKVSIVSRGRAGGYTLKLPAEDKHLRSRSEFESELAVLLSGYAAEKIVFKDTTTGASNDLKVASDLARRMITQYGMSDNLGPITFGEKEELVFLGKEISSNKNYSETIAFQIDEEIKKLITRGLTSAKKVLTQKIDTLHKIAKELISKETLEQKDFYALVR
ncbi:MAG: cell division protein FtsH [Candidatus Yanofskybacteria bacterium RIFCSPLOWO2_02_FULL_43_10]|uniref:ATP-dependent zinc metalloprotease FtsH n=1 Tax=Candidatus Yanofskybacteria bacterium RIFCSPLOWO2_12_FULL_43_11b TaxID=1802710 RepID=A0A1F8HA80_9BACT|nr:MAG: cell division protein FtsH [Candidatus Yanofskybacteria bacterium RIFCSPHIGHO2_01_FULL_43_32]OGN25303.1 MAG: cell division protein FtsH [Candidatus Yanofskybacteria bacterium RIFCSPLOWO2_01_FULL_43_46]OGN28589.1 MAG: cell division protein FtsH [Candidatus Yanofskybacteria bacterium RIFCSPLOWO2_02_FULL_43_10]OGN33898.1 MAG: cell division protein FtsH [Candidatus Yanofskybacteria bacterium RIFCSPLOWO2_12_FULL_43_11b]